MERGHDPHADHNQYYETFHAASGDRGTLALHALWAAVRRASSGTSPGVKAIP